jgi:hypothetical protein
MLRLEFLFYSGIRSRPREKDNLACISVDEVLKFKNMLKIWPQQHAKERPWITEPRPPA